MIEAGQRLGGLLERVDFAIEALGRSGPEAAAYSQAVVEAVKRQKLPNMWLIEAAGSYFSLLKTDAALAPLVQLARDASAPYMPRRHAVLILGRTNTRKAAEELSRLLDLVDKEEWIAPAALAELGKVDAAHLDAVPEAALLRRLERPGAKALRQPYGHVLRNAEVVVLGRKRSIPALVKLLGDDEVGPDAAWALADIGPGAIHALAEALYLGKDESTAANAAQALGSIPCEAACFALEEGSRGRTLRTIEHSVRWLAYACQLRDLKPAYEKALESLLSARREGAPGAERGRGPEAERLARIRALLEGYIRNPPATERAIRAGNVVIELE